MRKIIVASRGIACCLVGFILLVCALLARAEMAHAETSFQERQCEGKGWRPITFDVAGLQRRVLWKGPNGAWTKGAVLVLHGGGHHFQFCVANARIVEPQVRFSELAGLSSGGYMAVRAATRYGSLITAFAPVSSGDPYGWHRVCEKGMTQRTTVHGVGRDNETGKQMTEPDACLATGYPNEKPWDGVNAPGKPEFRVFRHEYDGINDPSCSRKVATLLRQRGYPEVRAYQLSGNRRRSLENHLWQDDYNRPLLEFFFDQLRDRR